MPRKRNRNQHVYDQLRKDLISGAILPGERLNTLRLSERFDVSLSVVREALLRLTAENLTVSLQRRGFRAAPLSVAEMEQSADALAEIEAICLRRSMCVKSHDWLENVLSTYSDFVGTAPCEGGQSSKLSKEFVKKYELFRAALIRDCDNEVLLRMRAQMLLQIDRHSRICATIGVKGGHMGETYRPIIAAITAGDADRAADLLAQQLRANAAQLAKAYRAHLEWLEPQAIATGAAAEPEQQAIVPNAAAEPEEQAATV